MPAIKKLLYRNNFEVELHIINGDRSDGEANHIWQQEHLLKMSLKYFGCMLPSIL